MALTCAMIKIKCLFPTGCQPSSIAPRGELPGPQIWATVYSSGWQPVLKLISSLPGMRLNCAPRRFFHMKENNFFLCIKEMRGFSTLLRSRQNHFKIFLFPSVLPLEETPYITLVFVVVVYRPFGRTPGPTHLGHGSVPTTNTDDRYGFPMSRQCPLCISVVGANALFGTWHNT